MLGRLKTSMREKNLATVMLTAALVMLAGVMGYSVGTPTSSSSGESETAEWSIYNWHGIQFKYPPTWKVTTTSHASAATQAHGEPAEEVGLWLYPPGSVSDGLGFGGLQFSCQTSTCRCFELYTSVHTCNENPETLRVFNLVIKSMKYHDPHASFTVSFPSAQNRLETGKTYTIFWSTSPSVQARKVSINIRDTSRQGDYRWFFLEQDAPNTGRYEWTVPVNLKSEGPYLITVFHSGTRPLHTPFNPYGWSEPFYITVADAHRSSAP